MKYWKYYKVPFFLGRLFRMVMEVKGWKVTKLKGTLVFKYRVSTYDQELFYTA